MNPLQFAFTALVLAVAMQRLWEVRRSAKHQRTLIALGAREHAHEQLAWMRVLHAGWLAATLIEAWLVPRDVPTAVMLIAAVAFAAGQTLRALAMHALGPRWTISVITLPGEPAIAKGIFRHLRHPNYLGVCLELLALPVIGGAYVTAIVASIANGVLLFFRIRAEEAALRCDSLYESTLGDKPRFIPGVMP
ncbi:MAG TPA: isoprenylcysteine carboxylmethyltransferase family protein [Gemmatimonadaceae bacterium]|nr:isoprenylcysteine carboxylmethyltransferase family protein [Gemmatimonadaceae bacterium]